MAKTMTVFDFMKKMQEKVPSNAFTSYSVYAEVDPDFMVDFGDASAAELAQVYGASTEEISEPASKRISYDGYGEFDEFDVHGDVDNEIAYDWLQKKFNEKKLNSFWPVVSFLFYSNAVILQPNGMIDNGKLSYDGMTLHEFVDSLSQFIENKDPSKCFIELHEQNGYLIYEDAIVDNASHKVFLKLK